MEENFFGRNSRDGERGGVNKANAQKVQKRLCILFGLVKRRMSKACRSIWVFGRFNVQTEK